MSHDAHHVFQVRPRSHLGIDEPLHGAAVVARVADSRGHLPLDRHRHEPTDFKRKLSRDIELPLVELGFCMSLHNLDTHRTPVGLLGVVGSITHEVGAAVDSPVEVHHDVGPARPGRIVRPRSHDSLAPTR